MDIMTAIVACVCVCVCVSGSVVRSGVFVAIFHVMTFGDAVVGVVVVCVGEFG